jgi:uncharacterized protein involved in exopolysaccharide biosynthesis
MSDESQSSHEGSMVPPVVYLVRREDESGKIDLADFFRLLWARKLLIIGITLLFAALGVAWALLSTPVFRVDVVLAPSQSRNSALPNRLGGLATLAGIDLNTGGENIQAVAILGSRAFSESFIADNNLLPVLYADQWDAATKTWKNMEPGEQPNLWKAVNFFLDEVITVEQDPATGLVRLSVEWTDPELAAAWAQELVNRINEQTRARALKYAESKLEYLNSELQRNTLIEVRAAITYVIQDQVQTIALAKSESEYAFRVVDPPRVPMERVRPKRALIVVLAAMAGGILSVCIVTVMYLFNAPPRKSA